MSGRSPDDRVPLLDDAREPPWLAERPRAVLGWQMAAAAGVAAAAIVGVVAYRAVAPAGAVPAVDEAPAPPPAMLTGLSVRDRAGRVGLRTDGSLAGLDGATAELRDAVTLSLRAGRLPAPADAPPPATPASVPTRGDRARQGFAVIGPLATAVATDRPTFRWRPLAGAMEYRVRVVDDSSATMAESDASTATTWQPDAPLPRGRVLSWQVEARTRTGRRVTPAASQPRARLLILEAAAAERATAALAAVPSDLAAAVIAARAGLYDEADAALARLADANPTSGTVAALRLDLAARRGH
jgi:hypothetical protein